MDQEQEPKNLTEEEAKALEARGGNRIVTNDLYNAGRLKNPYSKEPGPSTLESMNNPADHYIEGDRARFDTLEAAKQGNIEGITDPSERAALQQRLDTEGQKGLESLVESLQRGVTTGPVDSEKLGTHVAETQLGTDARGTDRMQDAIAAARAGVDDALEQAA